MNIDEMKSIETPEGFVNIKKLSDALGVAPSTIRRLWRMKKIPGYKIGHRTIRFKYDEAIAAFRALGNEG